MKSKARLAAGLLVIAGIVGAAIYAGAESAGSASVVTHQQEHEQQAARGVRSGDQFDCHSHGSKTYHCH